MYRTKRDTEKAVAFLEKALQLNEELGNKKDMVKIYGNLGALCSGQVFSDTRIGCFSAIFRS
ncbi:hypothetical protein [Methylobacter sp. YRD-M1]|uniref:hypothetical protein n=1 Tax=Methylobacter sp. YRD-M1 TaxID=2911520 RepID=UPI003FA37051